MDSREFKNIYSEYDQKELMVKHKSELIGKIKENVNDSIEKLLTIFEENFNPLVDSKNYSVYTGKAGVALMYLKLSQKFPKNADYYLLKSKLYIEECLRNISGRVFSFHCGDGGILAIGAHIYYTRGDNKSYTDCVKRLLLLYDKVMHDVEIPNELLYGRIGYLFALLYLNKYISNCIDEKLIIGLAQKVIESGIELSAVQKSKSALMYEWHEKQYLGAAHGFAGILYIIMKLWTIDSLQPLILNYVKPTLDYLLTFQYKSGNFPSSISSKSDDKLVHWCHGAPGWIYTLITAYQIYGDKKYLNAAEDCISVIWQRGLLKKGYGICHGVAGNAYAFLAMFNLTGNQKYLHMAIKFAEWIGDYGKHGCRIADRPYSLFEGMAGTIYFLADLLEPTEAKFPAYQI